MKSPADTTYHFLAYYKLLLCYDWHTPYNDLCLAACKGDVCALKEASETEEGRALLVKRDERGMTPFLHACACGCMPSIKFLLDFGCSLQECSMDGASGLYLACLYGKELAARFLMAQGADIHVRKHNGNTLAMAACQGRLEGLAMELLASGVHPHPPKPRRENLLNLALLMGQQELALHLLRWGKAQGEEVLASLIRDAGGRRYTPLHSACLSGLEPLAMELIRMGAPIDAANNAGKSVLFSACDNRHREMPELVALLLKKRCETSQSSPWQYSPIRNACARGYTKVVKQLLDAGVDVNEMNVARYTPLMAACSHGDIKLVKLLLAAGADPTIETKYGDLTAAVCATNDKVRDLVLVY